MTESTQHSTPFQRLASMDCSKHIEKKGKFSYLSWPWAVRMLREADESATWEVKRFNDAPFLKTECGFFVEVAVTVGAVTLSQIHPILNANNKPIPEPTSFDVNTAIQRCLVKAIALHGLGLYIYAGEDLPNDTPEAEMTPEDEAHLQRLRDAAMSGTSALQAAWAAITKELRFRFKSELDGLKEAAATADKRAA